MVRNYIVLNIIGYNEIIDYFKGIISLDEASYKIKLNSRHYAKDNLHGLRQIKNICGLIFLIFQRKKLLKEYTHCLISSLDLIIFYDMIKKQRCLL